MERFGRSLYRGNSVQSILTFVLVVLVTALLWVLIGGQTTHAADPTAAWSGDSIVYDEHGYTATNDFKDNTNTIPAGSTIYKTQVQTTNGSTNKKVLILYFTPGVDPPTATSVKYIEFTLSSTNVTSNPQNARDVSLTVKGQEDQYSSCSIEGIGWIVCPVSVFIAEGMDMLFQKVLAPMISARPSVLGDPSNSMYVAWNVMRNIANVAFVIAFLIIIYSQLTNFGVSNYGLKKLIPRLIIAAVLVNVSFIVTALAIDISNVVGYSIQNIFNGIRENLFHLTADNVSGINTSEFSWSTITGVILAGGGVIGGGYYLASGGAWLLIPLLLGLISVLILVVIVLAARQAIIVILVIIAPIAFVANLLPNTEKWFDKWKDLFFTMLIFFPAFSLVYGGSQLAGQIIIQNANDNIIMLLFGLAVQIAPLVITPILLKFSGGLLGRIAQITNNPSKGLLDRNKKWAESRAELTKQKNIAGKGKMYNPANWAGGMVRNNDFRKRNIEGRTAALKQRGDNKYHESLDYERIHTDASAADIDKQRIEKQNAAHIQGIVNKRGTPLNIKSIELENAKVSAERAEAQGSKMLSGYRAGVYNTDGNAHLAQLQKTMAENVIQTAAWKQGDENNKYVMQRGISDRIRSDQSLLDIAQGYGTADQMMIGRDRAQASAVATISKLNKDARDNAITLMQTEAVEARMSVKDYAVQNVITDAQSSDITIRQKVTRTRLEAALEIAADDGQVTVFDDVRANKYVDQDLVDAVVARNVGNFKSKGGFHTQADPNLSLQRYLEAFNKGERAESSAEEVEKSFFKDLQAARLATLSNTTSDNLGGMKYGAFTRLASDIAPSDPGKASLLDIIQVGPNGEMAPSDRDTVQKIFESLRDALTDPSTRAKMTDRLSYARDMEEAVRAKFFPDEAPLKLAPTERAVPGGGQRPASAAENGPLSSDNNASSTDSSPSEEQDN